MHQGKRDSERPVGRWARTAVGVAAICAAAAVPAGVADAATAPSLPELLRGGGPAAPTHERSGPDMRQRVLRLGRERLTELAAAETARQARHGSAAARAERRRSRSAFGALGGASALRLTQQQFGRDLEAVSTTPADALAADRVLGFKDDRTARVKVAGQEEPQLAISTVQPFRVRNAAGKKALVDLGLRAVDGGGFAPVNPIVDVTLPAASDGDLTVGDELSLTAQVPGGGVSAARRLGDSGLFYPEAGTDTDLVAAPTSTGLETFFTLRSADAPETASLTFDLPRGVSLLAQEDGSVNVVRGTKRIGRITAPVAKDAQGTPVATSASVEGSTVTIHTPHRGKDVAYPILVDPKVEIDSFEDAPDVGNTWDTGDGVEALLPGVWQTIEGAPSGTYADTGAGGAGLYIHDAYAAPALLGTWVWVPPQVSNHIYDVDFGPYDFSLGGDPSAPGVGVILGMVNEEGPASVAVGTDTADGYVSVSDEDTDTGSPGTTDVSIVLFRLSRLTFGPIHPYDYDAFLGGAVMHVEDLDDSDGPTFDYADLFSGPELAGTNWVANDGVQPFSMPARSLAHGVKRVEITAQQGSDPEIVLGSVEDPCDGTPLDPCPTHLGGDEFDVDWGLLDEGKYTLRFRATDGAAQSTVLPLTMGVDRTAPDLDPLTGDLADLDGLTTASTATLGLTVPVSEVGDDTTKSGLASVSVNDETWSFNESRDCTVDDCDEPEFLVPLAPLGDGSHTVTASAVDVAGNWAYRHITFTIDRP